LVVGVVGENGIEEMKQVGHQYIRTFLEYNVAYSVRAWGLVAAKIDNGPHDLGRGDGGLLFNWVRVYCIWWDRINSGGRRKE